MIEVLVIWIPDFTKVFKVECNALRVGIGGVLSQKYNFVVYSSKNAIRPNKSSQPMIKSFIWQFRLYTIGVIICYHKSLFFTSTMRIFSI